MGLWKQTVRYWLIVLWVTLLIGFATNHAFCLSTNEGRWVVTRLPYQPVDHPSINNSNEIVWAGTNGGIYSNRRIIRPASGINPHISNSGEVVYADTFQAGQWDLVSTTRGRLTYGGLPDVLHNDFDVNASGEVVYISNGGGYYQVFSTTRGQITFENANHVVPCINDTGEIAWNSDWNPFHRSLAISSTRGMIGLAIRDLNNNEDFCYIYTLPNPPSNSGPNFHIFTKAHGAITTTSNAAESWGGLNDAETAVWTDRGQLCVGQWQPLVRIVNTNALGSNPALEWSTNFPGYVAQFSTNLIQWQTFTNNPVTNSSNYHMPVDIQNSSTVFFRLLNTDTNSLSF